MKRSILAVALLALLLAVAACGGGGADSAADSRSADRAQAASTPSSRADPAADFTAYLRALETVRRDLNAAGAGVDAALDRVKSGDPSTWPAVGARLAKLSARFDIDAPRIAALEPPAHFARQHHEWVLAVQAAHDALGVMADDLKSRDLAGIVSWPTQLGPKLSAAREHLVAWRRATIVRARQLHVRLPSWVEHVGG